MHVLLKFLPKFICLVFFSFLFFPFGRNDVAMDVCSSFHHKLDLSKQKQYLLFWSMCPINRHCLLMTLHWPFFPILFWVLAFVICPDPKRHGLRLHSTLWANELKWAPKEKAKEKEKESGSEKYVSRFPVGFCLAFMPIRKSRKTTLNMAWGGEKAQIKKRQSIYIHA